MVAKKVFVSKCSSFSILFSAISSCCFQLLLCIVFSVYSQHLWWWDCWEKWHQGYLPSLTHLLMLLNWCWWDERSVAWIKRRAFIFMVISFYFYHCVLNTSLPWTLWNTWREIPTYMCLFSLWNSFLPLVFLKY